MVQAPAKRLPQGWNIFLQFTFTIIRKPSQIPIAYRLRKLPECFWGEWVMHHLLAINTISIPWMSGNEQTNENYFSHGSLTKRFQTHFTFCPWGAHVLELRRKPFFLQLGRWLWEFKMHPSAAMSSSPCILPSQGMQAALTIRSEFLAFARKQDASESLDFNGNFLLTS